MTKLPPRFVPNDPHALLALQANELLRRQKDSWTQLADGYASLAQVQVKEIQCDGFTVLLQFNPGRMVSTSAKVDPKSIRERRCFLCVEHLPSEQEGILVRNKFLILCNPAPIFHGHYTISHILHRPQAIEENVRDFLILAKEMGPDFTVFYNGPQCGASAPDHLHFQASPSGAIPVESDALDANRRRNRAVHEEVQVFSLADYGREAFVLEGNRIESIESALRRLIDAMKSVFPGTEEPLMNILASYRENLWRLIMFPRSKHRPEAFFLENDKRILVSPAAVDIGGLMITPLERDFQRLDGPTIEGIFHEVSLSEDQSDRIFKAFA
ncbi:MAG: DUF4922 domain-containing protein [Ignavibacteriales bacterium]|nr:DUF4922 domain-containing protein [Ignavibacteriales bacterium]